MDEYCEDGFDTYCARPVEENSDSFKLRREMKFQSMLSSFSGQARKMLIKNREFLDKLAGALIERHTLMSDDIQAIKATCTLVQC